MVELTVVLLVVSVLVVVGMASYARMTQMADDEAVQLNVLTAAKVQLLSHLESGVFTDDPHVLFDLEPTLRYSNDGADGTIVIRVEAGRESTDVCVFAATRSNDWFGIHHSAEHGDRYGYDAPLPCTPAATSAWSTDAW